MAGYQSEALYQMQINIKYDPEYTEEDKNPEICEFGQYKSFQTAKIICKNNDKIYQNKSINIIVLNTWYLNTVRRNVNQYFACQGGVYHGHGTPCNVPSNVNMIML